MKRTVSSSANSRKCKLMRTLTTFILSELMLKVCEITLHILKRYIFITRTWVSIAQLVTNLVWQCLLNILYKQSKLQNHIKSIQMYQHINYSIKDQTWEFQCEDSLNMVERTLLFLYYIYNTFYCTQRVGKNHFMRWPIPWMFLLNPTR